MHRRQRRVSHDGSRVDAGLDNCRHLNYSTRTGTSTVGGLLFRYNTCAYCFVIGFYVLWGSVLT